jgi:hypothetical protein
MAPRQMGGASEMFDSAAIRPSVSGGPREFDLRTYYMLLLARN